MNQDRESKYPLHEAARQGRVEVVESLLDAKPQLATIRDDDDRLPLHWAVSYNHPTIVSLLAKSSKIFNIDEQDGSGWTPLMMAASLKDGDDIVDLLLARGADVNAKNNNGQTALHFTASKNCLESARKLISHKASARVKDRRGLLPLHRAAAIGSVPMIKIMIEAKSPLNATDMDGLTALHHAISEGHGDAAVELLKAGAEVDKRDNDDRLAIDTAPDPKVRAFVLTTAEREGIDLGNITRSNT